jgi:hypothetical protein
MKEGDLVSPASPTHDNVALPLSNRQVAAYLDEVAELLATLNENPFRMRAYRIAADCIRNLREPAHAILQREGRAGLTCLHGIGDVLAGSIEHLVFTGRLNVLDQLRGRIQPEQLLASVAGIGPELAGRICQMLHIDTLEQLEQAAYDGRLARVQGMGAKRLQAVRDTLAGRLRRQLPSHAQPPVAELLEIDQAYREKAAAGQLRQIAPRRFNPHGEAWLPVLRTRRGNRRYTAIFSNTAQAHELGMTGDWVVIFWKQDERVGQVTAVTSRSGQLKGRRVVRGRDAECVEYYEHNATGNSAPNLEE